MDLDVAVVVKGLYLSAAVTVESRDPWKKMILMMGLCLCLG